MTTPAELARARAMNELLAEREKTLGALSAAAEKEKSLQYGVMTALEQQSAARQALIAEGQKDLDMLRASQEERRDAANKELAALERKRAEGQFITEIEQERIAYLEKIKDLTNEESEELAKQQAIKTKILQLEERSAKVAQKTVGSWSNMFGIVDSSQTAMGAFVDDVKESGSLFGAMSRAGKGMADALMSAFGPMNIIATIIENTIQWIVISDEAISSTVALTGASRGFASSVAGVGIGLRQYGLTAKDASAAFGGLYESYSSFTSLSSRERAKLTKDVAIMGKLGISGDQAAQGINTMTKTLGKSEKESRKAYKAMIEAGVTIGRTPRQMAADFAASMPKLAAWGKNAMKVFKDTIKAAKALGVETQELMGMMDQFMDFEKSADAVGRLNAMLGGNYLDSVTLTMKASQGAGAQMEYMQSAFRNAARDGRDLSTNMYALDGIAKDLGWTNEQLAKAMGNDARATEENIEKKKSLEQIAAEATTIMEKLAAVLGQLVGQVDWIVKGLRNFADWLLKITKSPTAKFIADLIFKIFAFGSAVIMITGFVGKFIGALKMMGIVAMTSNPVGWIVGAIALIGALIVYWDDLVSAVENAFNAVDKFAKKFTGGMFDGIDALLLFLGPIGWIIIGIRKVYQNWDRLTSYMEKKWDSTTKSISSKWDSAMTWVGEKFDQTIAYFRDTPAEEIASDVGGMLVKGFKVPFQTIQDMGKSLGFDIAKTFTDIPGKISQAFANIKKSVIKVFADLKATLVGWAKAAWEMIPAPIRSFFEGAASFLGFGGTTGPGTIPEDMEEEKAWYNPTRYFQMGVTDFPGGIAMVGEAGPELVTLPPHSNVITNENTTKIASALEKGGGGLQKPGATPAQTEHILELVRALRENTTAMTGDAKRDLIIKDIKLIMDDREFGRAVDNYINERYSLT